MLADQFDSTMLLLVLTALRVVAGVVAVAEVASMTEDAVVGVVEGEVVADLEIGADEVDPEVDAVQAQTEGALVISKAKSRLFRSRGIA